MKKIEEKYLFDTIDNIDLNFKKDSRNIIELSFGYVEDLNDSNYKKIRNRIFNEFEKLFKEINLHFHIYTLVHDNNLYIDYGNCNIHDVYVAIILYDIFLSKTEIKYMTYDYSLYVSTIFKSKPIELINIIKDTTLETSKLKNQFYSIKDNNTLNSVDTLIYLIENNPIYVNDNLVKIYILKNTYIKNKLSHIFQAKNFDLI
jgi:hypothetical protein